RMGASDLRDVRGDRVQLLQRDLVVDSLVPAGRLRDVPDADRVRHVEVVEAGPAELAEAALVAAEADGPGGGERVALTARLAVQLPADVRLARSRRGAATGRRERRRRGDDGHRRGGEGEQPENRAHSHVGATIATARTSGLRSPG